MKQEVNLRIIVTQPVEGCAMRVQRGKIDLVDPVSKDDAALAFEFPIEVDVSGRDPNFLGKYAQGPKDARFVYVNSGSYAGHHQSPWSRRAKISLMNITTEQVQAALASGDAKLETTFNGTGRDGGPTCASVKGIEWKVVTK